MEKVDSVILEKFPAPAMNCFTGGLVRLAELKGRRVDEAEVLECGDGYLLRAGRDEWGFPEFIFDVEECGLRGVEALGCPTMTEPVDEVDPIRQLRKLVKRHIGVVTWVNSTHLSYAEIYANSPAYLHSVLITDVSDDLSRVWIYDSLVVDRERHGCEAWMSADTFRVALTDRVRTETHDRMGTLYMIRGLSSRPPDRQVLADLRRQAGTYFEREHYRQAVGDYHRLCAEFFEQGGEKSMTAARRLFDHVSVLYVVPSLTLLNQSLVRGETAPTIVAQCTDLMDQWRSLGVLALKFEATSSSAIRSRIDARFRQIAEANEAMWRAIHSLSEG